MALGASRWNRGLSRCAKPPAGAALFCVCRTSRSRKRERIRGVMRPGLFSARRAPFRQTACKNEENLSRSAEHAEKDKGTRFDLRLLPFVVLQAFEILSACEDFIERSGFSPSPVLAFSACSAPLREVLPSPLRALPPADMPTALRGHVLGSLAECRSRKSFCGHPAIHPSR